MKKAYTEVLVVGAGQAGLSASYYLKKNAIDHVVLERNSIGNSWTTQRWDSFVLNSAQKINLLPGEEAGPIKEDHFNTAKEFADGLKMYVSRHKLPVVENSRVLSVIKADENAGFETAYSHAGEQRTIFSRQVIICSGAQSTPKLPSFAAALRQDMLQLHASAYRHPAALPNGAVLVVGSAQSGCQIAQELATAGRTTYLASSMVPRVPRRYRGKDIMDWLITAGFFDVPVDKLQDDGTLKTPAPQLTGVGHPPKTISLQSLAKQGVIILGSLEGATARELIFKENAAAHVAFADGFSAKVKKMVDEYIERQQLQAALPEEDIEDQPDENAQCVTHITSMDVDAANIGSIIWATGFRGDFSYLQIPVLDAEGCPVHKEGASAVDGLFFLGLPGLRTRGSALIYGVGPDAALVVDKVIAALRATPAKATIMP